MTTACLAFDRGPGAGLGHERRMQALASALHRCGAETLLRPLSARPLAGDVVVVDSYRTRADEPGLADARTLGAVDDLERDLAVDVLVDPNPGGSATAATRAETVLRGVDYALIDPSLASRRRPPADAVRRILVTTGGTDAAGRGANLAAAITPVLPECEVRLTMGPWSSGVIPPGVRPVSPTADFHDELAAADLVITAAGVTLLEALCLGRPVVTVVLAENQRRLGEGAASAGAACLASLSAAPEAVALLAQDAKARAALSSAAARFVDGRGAERVAAALLAHCRDHQ